MKTSTPRFDPKTASALSMALFLTLFQTNVCVGGGGKGRDQLSAQEPVDRFVSASGKDVTPGDEGSLPFDSPHSKAKRRKGITPLGLDLPSTGNLKAVTPITNTSNHFFSYNGAPVLLIGVSADNACHFNSSPTGQCGFPGEAYKAYIRDAHDRGLNVIRLWVSIVGGDGDSKTCAVNTSAVRDHPFNYDASNPGPDGLGRWLLDSRSKDYFDRLSAVVSYANSLSPPMFVEVTLFSPLTGKIGLGPYSPTHAYLSNGTRLRGFSNTANFTNKNSAEYLAMKPYIVNVIRWTVDALASFPNVFYEVANEPENIQPTSTSPCGWGDSNQSDPVTVAGWQAAIATEIKNYETQKYVNTGVLTRNHLVAVEPSTTTAADTFIGPGINSTAGSVINSHYTVFRPKKSTDPDISGDGLGAISMIRKYNGQPKIFGFNETKITGGACVSSNTAGTVDAGRAEAWEFMVNQGGAYNQFGYKCTPATDYFETRRQMGVLRKFLTNPVNVVTRTRVSDFVRPSWINPGPYRAVQSNGAFRYWAALEPTNTANFKRWLLYIHNSKDRNLVHDGYNAVVTAGGYRATGQGGGPLSVCLGSSAATYRVQYFVPKNAVNGTGTPTPFRTDTLVWPGATTCTPGGAGSMPLPGTVATYDYDLAILITP